MNTTESAGATQGKLLLPTSCYNKKEIFLALAAALPATAGNKTYLARAKVRFSALLKRFSALPCTYKQCTGVASDLLECSVHPLRSALIELCPMPDAEGGNKVLLIEYLCCVVACADTKLPVDEQFSALARKIAARMEFALCKKP